MAQKLGYFEEAGLDVSIDTPSDPAAPLKLVAAGQSDLAISYEPEVALAREQGLDVVADRGAGQPAADLADLAEASPGSRASPTSRARPSPPPASPTRKPS